MPAHYGDWAFPGLPGRDGRVPSGTSVGLEDFFAQAKGFRGDLDHFVVGDELDGLFKVEQARGRETNGVVGGGGTHVGELLFADDVDVEVVVAGVLADDHAFVDFNSCRSEEDAAVL